MQILEIDIDAVPEWAKDEQQLKMRAEDAAVTDLFVRGLPLEVCMRREWAAQGEYVERYQGYYFAAIKNLATRILGKGVIN